MSDDLLERATHALRETSQEPYLRAGATRARLLASAQRKYAPRHALFLRWALVAVALFASGTALAARLSGGLPELLRALTPWSASEPVRPTKHARKPTPEPHAPTPTVQPQAPAPEPLPQQPSIDAAPAPVVLQPQQATQRPTPRRAARPRQANTHPRSNLALNVAPEPGPEPETPAPQANSTWAGTTSPASPAPSSAATPTELTLFRRADRLHRARDPHALAAWDDYLKAAPSGTLAPEARYNRALCLIRLHKFDQARAALQPFAEGTDGNYRKAEARALLRSLDEH